MSTGRLSFLAHRRLIARSEARALRELVRAYGYLPRTAPTVWSVS